MTKESYLTELAHHLKKLPKDDYQNAMAYYTEYFEEAGPENEAQVIEELGTPKEVATELVQALLQGNAETSAPPPKNRSPWAIFGIAMAALLLSPLGLAGLCLGIGLMIAAFCVIGALIFSTVVAEFGLIVKGGQFIVQGIGLLTNAFGSGLMLIGAGLLGIGIALLIAILCFYLCKWIALGFSKLITRITQKRGV